MLNFCTLFDSNYTSRGLVLLESLKKVSSEFHLYIVAFDDECYHYLQTLNEKDLTVISLAEFEDEKLKLVKPLRTAAEYCWTCTPSIILYCINKFDLPSCIYIDADMVFFDDPMTLINENGNKSILITEHRYTRDYDVSATHGIYCVQFMYFKNDENGLKALNWWRDRCLEWCFAYLEDGKFGDQKYLDDWTERFTGVHVLQHPGGGLAPWNIQQYSLEYANDGIFISDKKNQTRHPVVFFHFHGLKFFSDNSVACSGALYELDRNVKEILYFPYIRRLLETGNHVIQSGFKRNPHGALKPSPTGLETIIEYGKNVIKLILIGKPILFKKNLFNIRLHDHLYKLSRIK
ncbi:MAG TPA: hypothetical protein VIL90_06070, partial [Puia sp.]|jgi:hypothetical protein